MELRTPAPLSDDEVYRFAETVPADAAVQTSAGRGANEWRCLVDADICQASTPRTMISDPVVVESW